MDYIDIPRSLIYKERINLKDFGVQAGETVNGQLFSNLKGLFMASDKAKELILRCFNNAYYICTLIPFEDFPETQVAEYEKLLLKEKSYDCEEVCAVSMAMVCKLLPACDAKWRSESNDLIKNIQYRFTHFQWMHAGARKSFEFMMDRRNTDLYFLPKNEFEPRDIIDAIGEVSVKDLAIGAIYACERLDLYKNQYKWVFGTDLAISRMSDYLQEMEEIIDGGYPQDAGLPNDYDILYNEAIDYFKRHIPSKKDGDDNEKTNTECHQPIVGNKSIVTNDVPNTENSKNCIDEQQSKLLAEKDKTINELQQMVADYASRFDPKDVKGKKVSAMTGRQHAIFLLAVLAHHNRIPNARTNLSYLLSFIASRNESTMKDYLKSRFTQEECDELAKWFITETPFIAELIRALPQKLEEDKAKKNRDKVLKDNKE